MHCVSRSGLVHGQNSFKNAEEANGRKRDPSKSHREEVWYDFERVLLDHVGEVLTKLSDGSLDDEIWGKIVVMERGQRIAKAYLRKTTIIVDGGDGEFDGKTLGFNHFRVNENRDASADFRSKIGDGVIIRMDSQGNLKALARGLTPIFVQGCREPKSNCASDKLIRAHGRLTTRMATETNDEERIFKIFEMRKFKQALEKETCDTEAKQRNLFLRTCVRIALVKDGGGADPSKTPCWFLIVNIVALEMARELIMTLNMKVPSFPSVLPTQFMPPSQFASLLPQANYSTQNLTQLLVAAAMQQQQQSAAQLLLPNLGVSPFSAATSLANSLSIAQQKTKAIVANNKSQYRRSSRRRPQSSSDESEEEEETEMDRFSDEATLSPTFAQSRSALSSSLISSSSNEHLEKRNNCTKKSPSARKIGENVSKKSQRPGLNQLIEQYNIQKQQQQQQQQKVQTDIDWKENTTTASGGTSGYSSAGLLYDSPRDLFDSSGSWSSGRQSNDSTKIDALQSAAQELSLDSHTQCEFEYNEKNTQFASNFELTDQEMMPDYSIYNYDWVNKTINSTSHDDSSQIAHNNNKGLPPPVRGSALCRSAKSVNVAVMLRSGSEGGKSKREAQHAQALSSLAFNQRLDNNTEYDATGETNHHTDHINERSFYQGNNGEYELLEENGEQCEFDETKQFHRFRFEQLLLENQRRGESLPPPPLPQHSSRIESRMQVGSREQSLFASSDAKAARPSARPRQRSQLAPKYVNASDSRLVSSDQNCRWQSVNYNRSTSAIPNKHLYAEQQRARSPSSRGLRQILQRFNSPKAPSSIHADFEEPALSWRRQF